MREKLPLPAEVAGLFIDRSVQSKDNPAEHSGRLRSFKHEEGNWATLVYALYSGCEEDHFARLQSELFRCLRPLEFQPMEDYHMSLSRTVTLRHHWIEDMREMLRTSFAEQPSSCCEVCGLAVLSNDEKTRSFLTLTVSCADDVLESYTSAVDKCFKEYNLPPYYKPPLFHISIGWCLGDVTNLVSMQTKHRMQDILNTALSEDEELQYFRVDTVSMKAGNKLFTFHTSAKRSCEKTSGLGFT
ncbi:hypothetical protein DPMN_169705 [Dreissena polymorpha]|uniref:U6 snRNA phosphodiesterase 1 n=1 Tax=Dreissena polymorpha TaxID=45954 RepID=A0A9D4DUV8_DREPO|nr:hypothetical protein DPMN_169705 [Dreissena polymorpha]